MVEEMQVSTSSWDTAGEFEVPAMHAHRTEDKTTAEK
jgi:hypothetical protein